MVGPGMAVCHPHVPTRSPTVTSDRSAMCGEADLFLPLHPVICTIYPQSRGRRGRAAQLGPAVFSGQPTSPTPCLPRILGARPPSVLLSSPCHPGAGPIASPGHMGEGLASREGMSGPGRGALGTAVLVMAVLLHCRAYFPQRGSPG